MYQEWHIPWKIKYLWYWYYKLWFYCLYIMVYCIYHYIFIHIFIYWLFLCSCWYVSTWCLYSCNLCFLICHRYWEWVGVGREESEWCIFIQSAVYSMNNEQNVNWLWCLSNYIYCFFQIIFFFFADCWYFCTNWAVYFFVLLVEFRYFTALV